MSELADLMEELATAWLADSDLGRELRVSMTTDEALDAVFELLNAGFLKIAVDDRRQPIGFTFNPIPRPLARTICRPGKH
jgi:hypothetical protein